MPDRNHADKVIRNVARFSRHIVSIIAFGSTVKGGFVDQLSDYDLIVVISDQCKDNVRGAIDRQLASLDLEVRPVRRIQSFAEAILKVIEMRTGMFVNHFVCRKSDLVDGNFHRIFNTSPLLSFLIAPTEIVLGSVLWHAKTISGANLLEKVRKPRISVIQVVKSMIMNLLLASGSLFLSFFSEAPGRCGLEAAKWSLYASYYYVARKSPDLKSVGEYFAVRNVCPSFIDTLFRLRQRPKRCRSFLAANVAFILLIHLWAICYRHRLYHRQSRA